MRRLRSFLAFALLALMFIAWAFPEYFGLAERQTRSASGGKVIVMDGDTLRLDHVEHRLYGIDAPEFAQMCKDAQGVEWGCGQASRKALANLVAGHIIACEERATDKYDRIIATCRTKQGQDLAEALALQGLAVSFGGFGSSPYEDQVDSADGARRGIWQGSFDEPQAWRAAHRR